MIPLLLDLVPEICPSAGAQGRVPIRVERLIGIAYLKLLVVPDHVVPEERLGVDGVDEGEDRLIIAILLLGMWGTDCS